MAGEGKKSGDYMKMLVIRFIKSKLMLYSLLKILLLSLILLGCATRSPLYSIKLYSNGTFIREWKSSEGVIYRSENNTIYFRTVDDKLIKITSGELKIEEDRSSTQWADRRSNDWKQ